MVVETPDQQKTRRLRGQEQDGEVFDQFDNMRYYWREFLRGRRKKYIGRWVVIDRGDFYGDFESRELADRSFGADPNTSNCPFITLVGYENVCNEFDILVENSNNYRTLRTLKDFLSPDGQKISMKYHAKEGQIVKAQDFRVETSFAGNGRFIAHILLQNSMMKEEGVGLVTSFLIVSGITSFWVHESVLSALENRGYDAFVCGHKIRLSLVPQTDPYEGFNLMGLSALRQIGIQCSGLFPEEFLLNYREAKYVEVPVKVKDFYQIGM
ncbi:hypothetical protein AKO1_008019 [Acrasis kona]|uniref:Uncharacterized protein n=1 Tax=Acrasis kona TaxID=1008807 RepID=A0AAW2YQS6_9EUKA